MVSPHFRLKPAVLSAKKWNMAFHHLMISEAGLTLERHFTERAREVAIPTGLSQRRSLAQFVVFHEEVIF